MLHCLGYGTQEKNGKQIQQKSAHPEFGTWGRMIILLQITTKFCKYPVAVSQKIGCSLPCKKLGGMWGPGLVSATMRQGQGHIVQPRRLGPQCNLLRIGRPSIEAAVSPVSHSLSHMAERGGQTRPGRGPTCFY